MPGLLQFGTVLFPRGGIEIDRAILSSQEPAVRVVIAFDVTSIRVHTLNAQFVVKFSVRVVADPDFTGRRGTRITLCVWIVRNTTGHRNRQAQHES